MRLLRVLLALFAAVTFAACSDDGGSDAADATTTTAGGATTAVESEATSTTAEPDTSTTVTEQGIGKLKLGMSLDAAKKTGEIGTTRAGCELGGSGELVADLDTGVQGLAYFNDELLTGIIIRSGAKTAAGIGPGSTIEEIEQAYATGYEVKVDESTEEIFGVVSVSVLEGQKQVFGFDVDPDSEKARSLGVPSIRTCE